MLVAFDVDCGCLVEGHRFIARGLSDAGTVSGPTAADSAPGFSFQYEFVPGLPPRDGGPGPYLVGIEYEADVPLPWEPVDSGAIAPFEGGESTHGSRGSWPLPRNAGQLRFTLYGIDHAERWPRQEPDGVLVVDLHDGSAQWQPANGPSSARPNGTSALRASGRIGAVRLARCSAGCGDDRRDG